MKRTLLLALLLTACGASDDTTQVEEPSAEPAEERPADTQPAETGPDETEREDEEDARARAIRIAEAFVRAQGYADVPPTVPDEEIVHEGIEGSIEMRLNMLDGSAVTANGEGDTWMVIFRYRDPQYEGRGRALQLNGDETPRFVHQDVVVSAWE